MSLPPSLASLSNFLEPDFEPSKTELPLSTLDQAITAVNKEIQELVSKNYKGLLGVVKDVGQREAGIKDVKVKVKMMEDGVLKLRQKISVPYKTLEETLLALQRTQRATSLTERTHRFITLARRLESQMTDMSSSHSVEDRALSDAALTIGEMELLLGPVIESPNSSTESLVQDLDGLELDDEVDTEKDSIRLIDCVDAYLPKMEQSKLQIVEAMERGVGDGLRNGNSTLLAASLQTASNLGMLPNLVKSLVEDLNDAVEGRIKSTFDLREISKDVSGPTKDTSTIYKSRARIEPTNVTLPQFTSALWNRLETMIRELAACCIKVYALEKVLRLKKDPTTQLSFLDNVLKVLEDKPSLIYWRSMSQALETQARDAVRNSPFIQQTLGTNYPRLLRLFHDFFSAITLHTDTIYTSDTQSPETVLVLRSIFPFETLYNSRFTSRLNEAIGISFTMSGGRNGIPTPNDGLNIGRVMVNELDAAKFDPLLFRQTSKGVEKALESFMNRCDNLLVRDYNATSVVGRSATQAQLTNADLMGALYQVWMMLSRSVIEYPASVQVILNPPVQTCRAKFLSVIVPLLSAVKRELSVIMNRIHRSDFSKPGGEGKSVYMNELSDKLAYVRTELLGNLKMGNLVKEWVSELSKFVVQTFLIHISIIKPLGEVGKLKLTGDMTELEFSLSQFLAGFNMTLEAMGDQFKSLRGFRELLWSDTSILLTLPSTSSSISPILIIHHLIVRSKSLDLPHSQHGWTEAEYVRWLNEHEEPERIRLLERVEREEGADESEKDELKGCIGRWKDLISKNV